MRRSLRWWIWRVPLAQEVADPLTVAAVVALMIAVALIASAVPAWRAVRSEPMRVLNQA